MSPNNSPIAWSADGEKEEEGGQAKHVVRQSEVQEEFREDKSLKVNSFKVSSFKVSSFKVSSFKVSSFKVQEHWFDY